MFIIFLYQKSTINFQFQFKLTLRSTSIDEIKVDVSKNVIKVLKKRFENNCVINLNSFYKDPDLEEFLILCQPKLLAFVLNLVKQFKPKTVKLCHNEIKTLDALEILGNLGVQCLDLRSNSVNFRYLRPCTHYRPRGSGITRGSNSL